MNLRERHDEPMVKQGVGFGVVGMIAAVLGTVLSGTVFSPGGWSGYVVVGQGFIGDLPPSGVQSVVEAALVGFVLGALLGAALHGLGVTVSGDPVVRPGRVAAAGVVGAAVGLSPALVVIGAAFSGSSWIDGVATGYLTLPLYAVSAALAWIAATVSVRLLMKRWDDTWSTPTVRATAAAAPLGGIAATAAGSATAWWLGFDTSAPTFVAVITVVTAVLAAAFGLARKWAVTKTSPSH
ncbi:hypothetical protein A3Q40_03411 [Rhodococcus sp. PBTS 1]|nr:hypothetical protein A3Q40_03411 [Rhodococcus sp. PBTS 1]